ncbi:sodium/proton antiporter, CPA1 family [Devosia lucknowensis]|uniref:Sodium/proton antiporter, CPA1 family n=1 Tax=Devosia lucknowensis TaxID=1096929 RepID=A0A1Y6FED7_9HYPH|nr:sodium:proton antiporter [Devosia lucknowensis]SMQ73009.1 sodium/proton antiporter, CPA1 family [Devosia lucknowensis]
MLAYVLIVVTVAIAVSALAERRNFQPALLVVMVGLAASYIPGIPQLEIDPQVILTIVLPPMLFSAARDFSFAEFLRRMGSIVNLGVFLVFATAVGVGAASIGALPELLPITVLILGVVVAPPDAVAAIAIGRRAGLPVGLMTVLKGESLINDAAALTMFSVLVAVATGTHAFIDNVPLYFLYASAVGIAVGLLVGNLAHWVRSRIASPSLATAFSVIVPFAAYLTAEELHASGVLAVVAAGFSIGHHAVQAGYEERMQESAFWRTIDTLLETFVFAYIGLQLRFVITDANEAGLDATELTVTTLTIFVTLVAIRAIWVFASAWVGRRRVIRRRERPLRAGRRQRPAPPAPLTSKENTVLAWTGMRGVVTLAAAAGTPLLTATGDPFPGREAIVSLAFLVTIASLLIQGLTLPWLIGRLELDDPNHDRFVATQRARAEQLIEAASHEALDAYARDHSGPRSERLVTMMRQRILHDQKAEKPRGIDTDEALVLGKLLLEARRSRLVAARDQLELDDTIVRDMLEKLDLEQAFMDSVAEG